MVICSDHRLLWQDSFKGVGRAITQDESILHKIIFIIINVVCNRPQSHAFAVSVKRYPRGPQNLDSNKLKNHPVFTAVESLHSPLETF